ncbi:SDR family oxidoreductase [Pseudoduganella namucuonensis]|uniref:NAD(P)-dependent dehydrogenase, short-chain alcohol dehydrogenase family n=1 Tax=Pseudoduganella namucuonensis TaxID=1035707 RepID=A0A1I7M5Q7_9BURK|nr:SDR family oxidoreductase [Pseudoduganella namucuonensis]SFV17281.1 NAD(P)-dependent dehydrogenase, short-chain alcohol dehydrogenase family [Pseudoduganella namucuonensis]
MDNDKQYAGKVVLVTGGGKGVGRGISECYLAAGATVVICGRGEPETLPCVDGRGATFHRADLRELDAIELLFKTIIETHGRLDVLVNNAGGTPYALAADASPRFHEGMIRLNLTSPLLMALQANAIMQRQEGGGAIVFVGSVSASRPSPGSATYGAAKAGIVSLTQSLAVEWAPAVRVVAVSPGLVHTEQSDLHYGDASGLAAVAQTIPLGRLATPRDIGDACVYVSSAKAGYVSGVNLLVHGGGERPAFLSAANVNKSDK